MFRLDAKSTSRKCCFSSRNENVRILLWCWRSKHLSS